MIKAKRFMALAVALVSTLSFAACGSTDSSSTSTNAGVELDSERTEQLNSAVEDVDWGNTELANTKLQWLAHYDINPADGKTEDPAIKLFKEKYGGEIEWVQATWDTRYSKLATLVSANDSPDMFPSGDMDAFPVGAVAGMFQPIDDYVDLSSEYWADVKTASDVFSIGGKHYIAVIDVIPDIICIYNTTVMDEHGYEQPADLYWEGEWTWDTMREMAIDFSDADKDMYGFDGWWWWHGITHTTGVPVIGYENDEVVNNLDNPSIQRAQDFIYELTKAGVKYPAHLNNWHVRGPNDEGTEGIGNGLTLFAPCGLYEIEDALENTALMGDVTQGDVMFVPLPSQDGSDPYMQSRASGYFLVTGAKNPEGFAAFMQCSRVATMNGDVKNIYLSTLTDDYGWTQDMIDMRDECYRLAYEKPVFEFGKAISSEFSDVYAEITDATSKTNGDEKTWAEVVSTYNNGVKYYVNDVNSKLADIAKKNQ